LHPDLVPYQTKDHTEAEPIYIINGKEIINGPSGYSSKEILANPNALGDPMIDTIRNTFDGEVTG
jgi:hypothetical protein